NKLWLLVSMLKMDPIFCILTSNYHPSKIRAAKRKRKMESSLHPAQELRDRQLEAAGERFQGAQAWPAAPVLDAGNSLPIDTALGGQLRLVPFAGDSQPPEFTAEANTDVCIWHAPSIKGKAKTRVTDPSHKSVPERNKRIFIFVSRYVG